MSFFKKTSVNLVMPKSVLTRSTLPVKRRIPTGIKMKYNTPNAKPNLKVKPLWKSVLNKKFSNKKNAIINNMYIEIIILLNQ